MNKIDLLSFDYCEPRGECRFEYLGEFLKDEMIPGDIYVIHHRPNSDRDIQIYEFHNQPERSKREDSQETLTSDEQIRVSTMLMTLQ